MANNFVQPGNVVRVTAPRTTAAGKVLKVGDLLGIATTTPTSGQAVEVALGGVWRIDKNPNLAIAAGAALYWNNTSFQVETTATTTYTYLGVALEAATTTATEVTAILGYRPARAFTA